MDDDLRSASQSMHSAEEKPAYAPKPPHKKQVGLKVPLILLVILAVILAAGLSLYKLLQKEPDIPIKPALVQIDTKPKNITDVPEAPLTQTYESTALSVGFKYPKTWKVIEANGGIRIDSPLFTYNGMGIGDVKGNFRVYIRQGSRSIDGTYIGRGIAIKPSEKLIYTQPILGQRTDTLLSSFGSESFESFSFFMIAGNFQLGQGDTLGPDYGKEPDAYIVVGGYSTPAAIDDLATTAVALNYYATTKAYKQAVAIIASLQLN